MIPVRRILVDIDSTLYAMVPLFSKHAAVKYGIHFSHEDYDHWDYWQKIGMTLEQWLETIDASHDPALVMANKPLPVLSRRSGPGPPRVSKVHIVSDRKPVSFDATKQWLDKYRST